MAWEPSCRLQQIVPCFAIFLLIYIFYVRIVKLVSLAAQKFISDVATDAMSHSKLRQNTAGQAGNTGHKRPGTRDNRRLVMTTEDLSSALGEQGVSVNKPPYYQ